MTGLAKGKYAQFYKSIGFERAGLFELIKKEFNPEMVIYPGCSIHVTPSFYFHHVVYVDKSQLATDFFTNVNMVTDLINQNKIFRESAYWKFIPRDFQTDLGLADSSFDLLLSLFSGKLITYCERYVKPNGLILTNSVFSDNDWIKTREDFRLLGLITCKNKKYSIDRHVNVSKLSKSKLRRKNLEFEYIDNEGYYLYRKITKQGTQVAGAGHGRQDGANS